MKTLTDNNADNVNADLSAESPPRSRRRSSFFERRSIVPQPVMDDDVDAHNEKRKDDEHLNQYYAQLLKEKELWKKEVQNRRSLLRDAELQLSIAKKSDKMCINYSILSHEDIEFLRGKPNLIDLIDSVKKLQKDTTVTYALYKRLNELEDAILNDAEDKLKKITNNLLENSAGIS